MKLTRPEWQLMNALWRGHPASAREIAERLPDGTKWAYTTIKTMLSRLVDKGALDERKKGNVSLYAPRLGQHQARVMAVQSLVADAFDGAFGSLMHFLVDEETLSEGEMREVLKTLDGKPQGRKKR